MASAAARLRAPQRGRGPSAFLHGQVLRLQRNQITSNFQELQRRAASLRELDISRNRLQWRQAGGEFEAGMAVLAKLKRLKDLRFAGNPVRPQPEAEP